MNRTKHTRLLAVLAATAVAAGIGAGGVSAGLPEEPPTKAEYIERADRVCKTAADKNAGLIKKIDNTIAAENAALKNGQPISGKLRKLSRLYKKLANRRDEVSQDIENLAPPASGPASDYFRQRRTETKAVRKYVTVLKNAASKAPAKAVRAQNKQGKKLNNQAKKSRRLARAYGFKQCNPPLK